MLSSTIRITRITRGGFEQRMFIFAEWISDGIKVFIFHSYFYWSLEFIYFRCQVGLSSTGDWVTGGDVDTTYRNPLRRPAVSLTALIFTHSHCSRTVAHDYDGISFNVQLADFKIMVKTNIRSWPKSEQAFNIFSSFQKEPSNNVIWTHITCRHVHYTSIANKVLSLSTNDIVMLPM